MLTKQSRARLDGVHPDLRAVILRAVDLTNQPVQISEGVRTLARQKQLYAQGRTAPGKIVTWTLNSRHLTGHAVDVVMVVGGAADWTYSRYADFAVAVRQASEELGVPVIWGGHWKTKDGAHFELERNAYPAGGDVSRADPRAPFDPVRFNQVMALVLDIERGFSPADPSMHGITKGTLENWLDRPVSLQEMKGLSEDDAKKIYRALYWNAVRADDLPKGVGYAVVDFAIHSGPQVAIKHLQRAAGAEEDGVIGPVTMAAVWVAKPVEIIQKVMASRFARMKTLDNWAVNAGGWTKRIKSVGNASLAMADVKTGPVAPEPIPEPIPEPPAEPDLSKATTEELVEALEARGYLPTLNRRSA